MMVLPGFVSTLFRAVEFVAVEPLLASHGVTLGLLQDRKELRLETIVDVVFFDA